MPAGEIYKIKLNESMGCTTTELRIKHTENHAGKCVEKVHCFRWFSRAKKAIWVLVA